MCERSERTQATQRNGVGLNELLGGVSNVLRREPQTARERDEDEESVAEVERDRDLVQRPFRLFRV